MEFTKQDLENLSRLARIDIKESEQEKMLHDMQAILSYVSEINEVSGERTYGGEEFFNVVRDDIATNEPMSKTPAILANAPKTNEGYVEVEQVLK